MILVYKGDVIMQHRKLSMNGKIVALLYFILAFSFLVIGIFILNNIRTNQQQAMSDRAEVVAQTVGKLTVVTQTLTNQTLSNQRRATILKGPIENVRLSNEAKYIVVMTMDHIRLTHPNEGLIGQSSTSGDIEDSFTEHYYTSIGKGESGYVARAFVPIMNANHEQIGVALVGYAIPTMYEIVRSLKVEILIGTMITLIFGAWGAFLVSRSLKRELLNNEPHEIAKMYIERTETFNAMHEGVIAIDTTFCITIFNDKAKQILNVKEPNLIGQNIYDVLPDSRLPEILDFNQPIYNKELLINQHTILSNRVPIEVEGETVGAIAIFQDRTDVKKIAEELTGVKEFVQALRVQNHEHKNKIHTVAGLIELGNYTEALHYIQDVKIEQEKIHQFLNERIQNKNIAGLLLSKVNRGKELGIQVEIDNQSMLQYLPEALSLNDLVIILGNLIENSFDALQLASIEPKEVLLSIDQNEQVLTILIEDNGIGMSDVQIERIFNNGYTTKNSKNHGIGLYLIQEIIQKANGTIDIQSTEKMGTSIVLTFEM